MDGSLLLWGALALCLFWGVGLHNRLMRLRARGLSALGSVEKHMRVCVEMVRRDLAGCVGVSVPNAAADTPSDPCAALLGALQMLEDALKDVHAGALRREALAHLGQSFDAVQIAWRRLSEVPHDLAGPQLPATVRSQWDAVTQRVETARGGLNQILFHYNEALEQFPARLVAGWMGFKPSGIL